MNLEDKFFVDKYLDEIEKKLFYKLKENEQKHSVRVALLVIKTYEEKSEYKEVNLERVIRCAILHDVGKSENTINVFQKVFMVLAGKYLKAYENVQFIYSYYNHGEISYNLLKAHIQDEKLLFLIRNHHNNMLDKELALVEYCDNKN